MQDSAAGRITQEDFDAVSAEALRDTIQCFEATGSPVITDGEQTKPSFATYPIDDLSNLARDGVVIRLADGHTRRLPRLISGPFRCETHAPSYLEAAKQYTSHPLKQAVIWASALSLLYPQSGIPRYSRQEFLVDLVGEAEVEIRQCFEKGAHKGQIDFTEARLSVKLDPSEGFCNSSLISTTGSLVVSLRQTGS